MILCKFQETCRLGKNPSPRWDLNPRPSVIQWDTLPLSYWRLCGEQGSGSNCGRASDQITEGRKVQIPSGTRIFFCLIFSSFFLLDKVYTARAREQRFDEKDIRNQANLAKYLEKDDYDWNYIDSFLEKLGNTFSFST